jgi:hypothetical protein
VIKRGPAPLWVIRAVLGMIPGDRPMNGHRPTSDVAALAVGADGGT